MALERGYAMACHRLALVKVVKHFIYNQNSVPATGLYTCIKLCNS